MVAHEDQRLRSIGSRLGMQIGKRANARQIGNRIVVRKEMKSVGCKRSKRQFVKPAVRNESELGSLEFRVYLRNQGLVQNP